MIQFAQPLADAYVSPARNILLPSAPGRQVKFLQGHAVIKTDIDLMAMLRRAEVKLVLTPYALSWADEWFAQVGERVQAEVLMPEPQVAWDSSLRRSLGTDGAGADS